MNCERTETLLGAAKLARLKKLSVAVYGVGGVGGWCAEALLRSGVAKFVLIDEDVVQPTNLNRQCCATQAGLGRVKVEEMKARLASINPEAIIEARQVRYLPGDEIADGEVVIDAIDSVDSKCALILAATAKGRRVYSSLGAAKRLDPTLVTLKRFSKVEGDALARAMRRGFKQCGEFPQTDFLCAVSTESPVECEGLGSMMPVTAAFGLALAAAVIKDA